MRGLLTITLKSDLCAAVGKGYAAMIDTDTALNEYGLPYIPARRLKGCLRELAEYCLAQNDLDRIFGRTGNDIAGTFRIADARLKNEKNIVAAIQQEKLSSARVADLYCSVRSETAIEDDHAKDNSLRFTRVVNRLDPLHEGQELAFYAPVQFEDGDKETLTKIFRSLRNIGYRRNRGFGAVECTFTEQGQNNGTSVTPASLNENKKYILRLTVRLNEDMMLPDTDANHSADYIAGTNVLGAFATRYIEKYGEADFNDLFYSDVSFGNLYPVTASGTAAYPVPLFLAKIKAAAEADKGVKNLLLKQEGDTKTYKPIKHGYFAFSEKKVLHPQQKTAYHLSNVRKEDSLLYMQECLTAGQCFTGEIHGSGEKLSKLLSLLCVEDSVSFGRSKTAQYADCTVTEFEAVVMEEKQITVESGKKFAYVLESDAVLTDENGIFTPTIAELQKALSAEGELDEKSSNIKTKVISGYNAKWNLKKPQFPAICAGGCLIFTADKTLTLPEMLFIGEKQNEGFGVVRVIADAENYLNQNFPTTMKKEEPPAPDNDFLAVIRKDDEQDNIIRSAIDDCDKLHIDIPSQIGRLTLMLKEANEQPEKQYQNFLARIDSIKTEEIKEEANEIFDEKGLPAEYQGDWNKTYLYAMTLLTVKKYRLRRDGKNDD